MCPRQYHICVAQTGTLSFPALRRYGHEPVGACDLDNLACRGTTIECRDLGGGVDRHAAEAARVGDQTARAERAASPIVPAAAHRDRQVALPADAQCGAGIFNVAHADENKRIRCDRGIPQAQRSRARHITRQHDLAGEQLADATESPTSPRSGAGRCGIRRQGALRDVNTCARRSIVAIDTGTHRPRVLLESAADKY